MGLSIVRNIKSSYNKSSMREQGAKCWNPGEMKEKGKTEQWETFLQSTAKLARAGHRALKTFQTQLLLSKWGAWHFKGQQPGRERLLFSKCNPAVLLPCCVLHTRAGAASLPGKTNSVDVSWKDGFAMPRLGRTWYFSHFPIPLPLGG